MSGKKFAYSQFCDDLRFEVGNKISLMGIYTGQMFVEQVPITLPKLCVTVTLVVPKNHASVPLAAKLFYQGDVVGSQQIASDMLEQIKGQFTTDPREDRPENIAVTFNFLLTPFNIGSTTPLSAVAYFGDEEWPAGRLDIRLGDPPIT
jgi:hypothetical protein